MCGDSLAITRRFSASCALRTAAWLGLVLIISFVGAARAADDVTFGFAARMGGTLHVTAEAIAVDATGNVYTTGWFMGTADFDPGAGTYNLTTFDDSRVIFVSKLDSAGNFVWAKRMGSTSSATGFGIAVDATGNVYTTGEFWGTGDFDPGAGTANLTSAGGHDIYVSKLDSAGNFVWAKRMGGTSDCTGLDITVDASGNVYTTGDFRSTADFNPGAGTANLTSAGKGDVFVSKLNSAGNFVWAKAMRGSWGVSGFGIAVDASGNVYTTGDFQDTVDFDPGAGTFNLTGSADNAADIFVSKLDSTGNFVWAKAMGGPLWESGNDIAVDASGNVYTTGDFESTTDFDPGAGTANLTSVGGTDIFVSKLDSSGNFVWVKRMGGTSRALGFGIALDALGAVYTTGFFSGTIDFDPGVGTYNLIGGGGPDAFVSKLNSAGNFVWAKRLGGSSNATYGFGIAVDASGAVHTTGMFWFTADFDPCTGTANLISAGNSDAFVSKLVVCEPALTVWADFGFTGCECGLENDPFSTLAEALANVLEAGTLMIKGDMGDSVSNETMTIDQAVTIEAVNGTVRIGAAGGRDSDDAQRSGFVSRD